MYEVVTNEADMETLGCTISSMYYLATLEIAIKLDSKKPHVVLILGSYAVDDTVMHEHGEGYWVPPNIAYHISYGYTPPSTNASLRKLFASGVSKKRVKEDVEQLAYSLGLRDIDIERSGHFIEIKNSPRTPELIRAFYIDRFVLKSAESKSLRNLADFESRHGIVFAPLDSTSCFYQKKMSTSHKREEVWFLGKPLQSNVEHLIFNPTICSNLSGKSIQMNSDLFSLREEGLVCVVDVAGYGTALQYARKNMHSFTQDSKSIQEEFRHQIIEILEQFVSTIGTTQVQLAGDGFLAAFPARTHSDIGKLISRILEEWERILFEISRLNGSIKDVSYRIGSRMSLCYGDYRFGRIGKLLSFSPSFDGELIIETARLEQALAGAAKSGCKSSSSESSNQLEPKGNYIIVKKSDDEHTISINNTITSSINWKNLGHFDVDAKEFTTTSYVYEFCKRD